MDRAREEDVGSTGLGEEEDGEEEDTTITMATEVEEDRFKEEVGVVEGVQGLWLTPPPPDLHWSRPRYKYSLHTKDGSYTFLMKCTVISHLLSTKSRCLRNTSPVGVQHINGQT